MKAEEIPPPGPERDALDASDFFLFLLEREAIYARRSAGLPAPWTSDPILRDYKFTNVFRENDKTTRWFRENVRDPLRNGPPDELIFATILFRWFNRIDTGEQLLRKGYFINFRFDRVEMTLRAWRPKGPWVTGAYIIHTPNGRGWDKLRGVVENARLVWRDRHALVARWERAADESEFHSPSLEWATKDLTRYRDLGMFMAYEIVCDLRHTPLLENAPDICSWANVGPGARRGASRIRNKGSAEPLLSRAETLTAMRELYAMRSEFVPYNLAARMEMREIEHTLCEFDKYMRVKRGEGRPREVFNGRVD